MLFLVKRSLFIGIWVFMGAVVCGQSNFPPWSIGMNLGPLMSGTPEVQVDRRLGGRYAGIFAGGYTYKPAQVGCLVDDGASIDRMRGGFMKAGLKARFFCLRGGCNQVHLQLHYVASFYNEQGTVTRTAFEDFESSLAVTRRGVVHGLATSAYWDLALYQALRLRLGVQVGRYWRSDNFTTQCRTCQPGFGVWYPPLPVQCIMGFAYDLGVGGR